MPRELIADMFGVRRKGVTRRVPHYRPGALCALPPGSSPSFTPNFEMPILRTPSALCPHPAHRTASGINPLHS